MTAKGVCTECYSREVSLHQKVAIPLLEGHGKLFPFCGECGLVITQYNFSKTFKRRYIKSYGLPIEVERLIINYLDKNSNFEVTFTILNTLIDTHLKKTHKLKENGRKE